MIKKEKIALVLLGGGTAGAFEVGVLKSLLKKIDPDFFVGTSMGAVNCAKILQNKNLNEGVSELEYAWKKEKLRQKNFLKLKKINFINPFAAKSLYCDKNLIRLLKENIGDKKFEDLSKPLYVSAIDLDTTKTEFFNKGPLFNILMASCAATPFLPPYKINNKTYIDGGLDIGSHIQKADKLGAEKIIIIQNGFDEKFSGDNIFANMKKAANVILTQHLNYYLNKGFKDRVFYIKGVSPNKKFSFRNLKHTDELIKQGEISGEEFLNSQGY